MQVDTPSAPHTHRGRPWSAPPPLPFSRRVRTPWVRACEASRVPTCLAIARHSLAPNKATASWYSLRSLGFHTPALVDWRSRLSWSAPAPQVVHASEPLGAAVNAAAAAAARLARPGATRAASGVRTRPAAELEPGSDGWARSARSRPPPTPERSIPSPIRRCRLSTARAGRLPRNDSGCSVEQAENTFRLYCFDPRCCV